MIKPQRLKKGDKVAIVSLSSGILGDKKFIHRYEIGKRRLEEVFGVEVIAMPNALKGIEFIRDNPQLRAKDLMDAFCDTSIKAIICAIGGDDTMMIEPYIDYDVIRNNPKIFMGYSDTTANHFMMHKAGLVSYYGPSLMKEFAEYVKMTPYTMDAVNDVLFNPVENYQVKPSRYWSDDFVPWSEENINTEIKYKEDTNGYEVLQGGGKITGKLLGGCLDAFPMYSGTSVWPKLEDWRDKILFVETSEDKPLPEFIKFYLYNLGFLGILNVIKGVIVGKPKDGKFYEEYKDIYTNVAKKFGRADMPIMYNVNFGHATPIGILPIGTEVEIDFDNKKIVFVELPVE